MALKHLKNPVTLVDTEETECLAYHPGEWFLVVSHNRDSRLLEQHNYRMIKEELRSCGAAVIEDYRRRNPLCGWSEGIYVNSECAEACSKADDLLERLQEYPIFNEDAYDDALWQECNDWWSGLNLQERLDYCGMWGLSPYAARRNSAWYEDDGAMQRCQLLVGG